jgi:hypothetical protein
MDQLPKHVRQFVLNTDLDILLADITDTEQAELFSRDPCELWTELYRRFGHVNVPRRENKGSTETDKGPGDKEDK